ncbi:hypothetical protein B566_EDAN001235 [Ephemera danica]|nr:hypothetical protein B566_EDAN001235 [Ephemera danica]
MRKGMAEDKKSRGWNDPPPLPVCGVNAPSSTSKRPGINLNKRVAFPLSGSPSSVPASSSLQQTTPPKLPPVLPPKSIDDSTLSSSIVNTTTDKLLQDFDLTASYVETEQNFNKILEDVSDLEQRTDVEKRLTEMKKAWKESMLDKNICYKLLLISRALLNKDAEQASSLQLELISQWPTDTGKWAVAIRCLVNHLRLTSEPAKYDAIEANAATEQVTDS